MDYNHPTVSYLKDISGDYFVHGGLSYARRLREALVGVVGGEEAGQEWRGGDLENSPVNQVKCLIFMAVFARRLDKIAPQHLEEVAHITRLVLSRSTIEEFELFQDLHNMLIAALTQHPHSPKVKAGQEELKAHVLHSLAALALGSALGVLQRVCSPPYTPTLGHTLYILLAMAREERSKTLRLQALLAVQALGWRSQFEGLSASDCCNVSRAFVSFLPGIVQATTKVARAGVTQGNKVIATAVDTWTYFVTLVMSDDHLSQCVPHLGQKRLLVNLTQHLMGGGGGDGVFQFGNEEEEEEEEEEERRRELQDALGAPSVLNVRVNKEWILTTAARLAPLAEALTTLSAHPHWNVRLAMARWGRELIQRCHRSLPGCVDLALDTLLALHKDEVEEVAVVAVEGLRTALGCGGGGGGGGQGQKVEEMIKKKVMTLVSRLPCLVKQEDDLKTLTALRQLEGCLEALGGREGGGDPLSPPTTSRLLHSLALTLSLDTSDPRLLHQRSSVLDPFQTPQGNPTNLLTPHKHFRDARITIVARDICWWLGGRAEVTTLTHLCMDLLHLHATPTHLSCELMMLMSMLLEGAKETDTEAAQHAVKYILEELLSPDILGSPLPITPLTPDTLLALPTPLCTPTEDTKAHILRVAHALNLIGSCAELVKRNYIAFFPTSLCPIMEFAGTTNEVVSLSATRALERISRACGCAGVGELIRLAAPQFWYPLSMRLKRLTQYPAAPLVLQTVLRYAGAELAAYMEELLEEAITALDLHHVECSEPLLRVLLAYVSAVAMQEGVTTTTTTTAAAATTTTTTAAAAATTTTTATTAKEEEEEEEEERTAKITELEEKGIENKLMIEEEEKGHQNEGMKEEKENEGNDDKDGTSERKEKTKEEINGQLDEGKEKEGGKDIKTDKGEGKGIRKDRIGELARFLEDYHLTKTEVKMGMEEEEAKKMEREKREEEEKEVRAKEEEEKKVIKQEEEETKKWETEQNQTIDEPSPDTPNLPPRNIELVVDVLERCAHLLHMGGRGGRLLTLEVAKWGCRALTNHQDQLLPCLHKLWRPLLLCLTHSDLVVGVRTLVFVSETVALSGDFLRRRVATEALPLVHKFLRNQSIAVATKECITGTTKAVRTYLTTLTALVPRLNLGVTETAEIVEIAGLFLDLRHPPEVTRAALGLLEKVAETCPEHVWLSLAVGLPAACLTHPSPLLPPVKIGSLRQHNLPPTEVQSLFESLS